MRQHGLSWFQSTEILKGRAPHSAKGIVVYNMSRMEPTFFIGTAPQGDRVSLFCVWIIRQVKKLCRMAEINPVVRGEMLVKPDKKPKAEYTKRQTALEARSGAQRVNDADIS